MVDDALVVVATRPAEVDEREVADGDVLRVPGEGIEVAVPAVDHGSRGSDEDLTVLGSDLVVGTAAGEAIPEVDVPELDLGGRAVVAGAESEHDAVACSEGV